jgi:uncharacterized RmlC-like cupin family protein
MAAADEVRHIPPSARTEADPTPGMVREQAIAVDGLWAGLVTTDPGMTSGWHHHGDHATSIYVSSGRLRMEFGAGGAGVVEAAAGDFVLVPRGAVHREGNPGAAPSELVVVRAGSGPTTVNVDGPAPVPPGPGAPPS